MNVDATLMFKLSKFQSSEKPETVTSHDTKLSAAPICHVCFFIILFTHTAVHNCRPSQAYDAEQ